MKTMGSGFNGKILPVRIIEKNKISLGQLRLSKG